MKLFNKFIFLLYISIILNCSSGGSSPTEIEANITSSPHYIEAYKPKTFNFVASAYTDDFSELTISFTLENLPVNGQVVIDGYQATYTPNAGYVGMDYFTVTASAGNSSISIPVSVDVFDNPYKEYQLTNITLRNNVLISPEGIDGSYGIYNAQYNGIEREFLMYIPNDINPYNTNELPVLFYFHGQGSDANPGYTNESIQRLREIGKFIHVRPSGLAGPTPTLSGEWGSLTGWNYLYPGIREEHEDIEFVNALINYIHDTQSVTHRGIYVQGFSSGGTFVPVLGSENELIDGIQSMGSIMHTYYNYSYEQPIKFQILKGTNDQWHPYEYSDEHPTFWGIDEGMMHLAQQYSCNDTTRVTIPDIDGDGNGGYRSFTECSDGSKFESFKLVNEKHIQFWGTRPISGYGPWSSDVDVWELLGEMID